MTMVIMLFFSRTCRFTHYQFFLTSKHYQITSEHIVVHLIIIIMLGDSTTYFFLDLSLLIYTAIYIDGFEKRDNSL